MKRHNGIEWDDGGRWTDANNAESRIASLEAELAEANGLLDEIDKTISDNPGEWAEFYTMNIEDILAKQKGGE